MNHAISVEPCDSPDVRYVLRLGDTCLILAQRLGEWCGHAPILEEDIALANMALDLIGQARGLLTHAGALGQARGAQVLDEDQLAFLRSERHYFNPTLVELPGGPRDGDFAVTVLRNAMVSGWMNLMWTRLLDSSDPVLGGIAGQAVKEARYHFQHARDWVIRLGLGTVQSRDRLTAALDELWRYSRELLEDDEVDEAVAGSGLGPRWSSLKDDWEAAMQDMLRAAKLSMPPPCAFSSQGKRGVHSEHIGYILSDMQYLQRSYPGGVW